MGILSISVSINVCVCELTLLFSLKSSKGPFKVYQKNSWIQVNPFNN